MTSERRETVRGCHSYPTKSGNTHFISHDTRNIFHVVRGFLRCCTEGTYGPGTYGGRFHNGHGAIAVRYLLDQELNLAFRFIAVCPPPRVKTTRDKLERFLRYGKILVRSVVPLIHHIDPMWTPPSFENSESSKECQLVWRQPSVPDFRSLSSVAGVEQGNQRGLSDVAQHASRDRGCFLRWPVF